MDIGRSGKARTGHLFVFCITEIRRASKRMQYYVSQSVDDFSGASADTAEAGNWPLVTSSVSPPFRVGLFYSARRTLDQHFPPGFLKSAHRSSTAVQHGFFGTLGCNRTRSRARHRSRHAVYPPLVVSVALHSDSTNSRHQRVT